MEKRDDLYVIYSDRLANLLMEKGFRMVKTKPSTKVKGRVVFLFENTELLEKTVLNYLKAFKQ